MPALPAATKPDTPVILGIPFDANSSWLRGAAGAPPIIRVSFRSDSSNSWTETGVDLSAEGAYCDAGDLKFTFHEPFAAIEARVGELLDKGMRVVSLGGDHSITLPILRAFGKRVPELTVIHFDAHPDLYDHLEGNRHSHACPFARVMEEGAAKRLVQVGIRTLNGHQREQVKKFGVEVLEMRHLPALDWKDRRGRHRGVQPRPGSHADHRHGGGQALEGSSGQDDWWINFPRPRFFRHV